LSDRCRACGEALYYQNGELLSAKNDNFRSPMEKKHEPAHSMQRQGIAAAAAHSPKPAAALKPVSGGKVVLA